MGLFDYDAKYAAFDVTAVQNQFILEYMPGARGDFVKVYLYGLMQCAHPSPDMSVARIAHDLNQTEDDVLAAFRYWERRGLVRRISDEPASYQYLSVVQQFFLRDALPTDHAYEDFAESLYALFGDDRKLHGKETSMAYEWVEELGLPPEVVLMMLNHLIATAGKQFKFVSAEKLALRLKDENVTTIDEAELVLSREQSVESGTRRIIRKLGKRSRAPSDPEMDMYRKWVKEWGYTPEAIEAACEETTKGEPTMAYLDGILRGMRERSGKALTTGTQVDKLRQSEQDRVAPLKALLGVMNIRGVSINAGTLAVYDQMRALYPDEVVLMAGQECARSGGDLSRVLELLESWRKRGLGNAAEVRAYIDRFNAQNTFIGALYELWGREAKPSAGDRALLDRWEKELAYGEDMILACAAFAKDAEKPMPYLDKLLRAYFDQGVRTPEQAIAARSAHQQETQHKRAQTAPTPARGPKVVQEQNYTQREYQDSGELPEWMQKKVAELKARKELKGDA